MQKSTTICQRQGLRHPALYWDAAQICAASSFSLSLLGYPDRALGANEHSNSPRSRTIERHPDARTRLRLYQHRRDLNGLQEHAKACLALANELGDVVHRSWSEIYLGWADAISGNLSPGIAQMRHHLSEFRASGKEIMTEHFLAMIAVALCELKQFDEGIRTMEPVFSFIERTNERMYEAELHRLKGELFIARDTTNASQAEQCFRTGIVISRRQHAKSWELRATTSLARLLRDTGGRDEARAMLTEIYNWFTEGFDTADL